MTTTDHYMKYRETEAARSSKLRDLQEEEDAKSYAKINATLKKLGLSENINRDYSFKFFCNSFEVTIVNQTSRIFIRSKPANCTPELAMLMDDPFYKSEHPERYKAALEEAGCIDVCVENNRDLKSALKKLMRKPT